MPFAECGEQRVPRIYRATAILGRLNLTGRIPVPRDEDRDDDDRDRGPRKRREAPDEDAPRKRREPDDEDSPRKRREPDDEVAPRKRRQSDDEDAPRKRRADDDDYDSSRVPPYPNQLKIAGYLWMAFGILILANGLYTLAVVYGGVGGGRGAVAVGGGIGVGLLTLFGAAFIHVGLQSITGTAKDTMGNGIGSLVFAALQFGSAFWAMSLVGFQLLLLVQILAGAGLLLAGVLALLARAEFLDWKKAKKLSPGNSDTYFGKRKSKPKREDEDDD
jgi:hypothetical protein